MKNIIKAILFFYAEEHPILTKDRNKIIGDVYRTATIQ